MKIIYRGRGAIEGIHLAFERSIARRMDTGIDLHLPVAPHWAIGICTYQQVNTTTLSDLIDSNNLPRIFRFPFMLGSYHLVIMFRGYSCIQFTATADYPILPPISLGHGLVQRAGARVAYPAVN